MHSLDDLADKLYQARHAQRAARDHLFVTLRDFLEKHGDVSGTVIAVTNKAERSNCSDAELKPLARAFARTDYDLVVESRFGKLVADQRERKTRKKSEQHSPSSEPGNG